jgi:hypothetical protein
MMPVIKMSINKEMETHIYKPLSSIHESVGNVKLHTVTLMTFDTRGAVIGIMMNCIIIAYKRVTC